MTGLTLGQYVQRRTGVPLGAKGSLQQMLRKSLGASTFDGFWRYWNPIWGYYLGRYVNGPLRKVLPAAPALVATFAVSGAIHDVAILAVTGSPSFLLTTWFTVLGLTVAITRRTGLRYGFGSWVARASVNVGLLAAGFGIAELVLWASGL